MIKRLCRRLTAILLAVLLVTQVSGVFAEGAHVELTTCVEAAAELAKASDNYWSEALTAEDVLGEVEASAPLTNARAAQLILNAFGHLPEPHYLRVLVGFFDTDFHDVPPEYENAVSNLTDAGLWVTDDLEHFRPDEMMPMSELHLLIDRIHAYLGSSIKDDLTNTVNHAQYYEMPSFLGEDASLIGSYHTNLFDWEATGMWALEQLQVDPMSSDPDEQRIAACFSTWCDVESRDLTLEILRPYLDLLENAGTADEMRDAYAVISADLGVDMLLSECASYPSPLAAGTNIIAYSFGATLDSASMYAPGNWFYDYRVKQLALVFEEYGWDAQRSQSAAIARASYLHDAATIAEQIAGAEPTSDECEAFVDAYMAAAGYAYNSDKASFSDVGAVIGLIENFNDENLEGIRAQGIYRLLTAFALALPPRLTDLLYGYDNVFAAGDDQYFDPAIIVSEFLPMVQWSVTRRYLAQEEGQEAERNLAAFLTRAKEAYREMLEEVDWLEPATKEQALQKLERMQFCRIWPDDVTDAWTPDYISADEGGTFVENMIRYRRSVRSVTNDFVTSQSGVLSALAFSVGALSMNAYALLPQNACYISLGSLIGSASDAEEPEGILGSSLYFTIAHEISHHFDLVGRKYDADGVIRDWWSEADRQKFEERMQKIIDLYDGYEYAPGLSQPGETVVQEAIADNGALCCLLKMAEDYPDFDYAEFFSNVGRFMGHITTRKTYEIEFSWESHPVGRARANPLVANFDEFYDAFGVVEGDGMYIAPEQRINFWGAESSHRSDTADLVTMDDELVLAGIHSSTALSEVADMLRRLVPGTEVIQFEDSDAVTVPESACAVTGWIATCADQRIQLAVRGDVLGTGVMNLPQLVRMGKAVNGTEPLTGAYLVAGDLTGDGIVNISDMVQASCLISAGSTTEYIGS